MLSRYQQTRSLVATVEDACLTSWNDDTIPVSTGLVVEFLWSKAWEDSLFAQCDNETWIRVPTGWLNHFSEEVLDQPVKLQVRRSVANNTVAFRLLDET